MEVARQVKFDGVWWDGTLEKIISMSGKSIRGEPYNNEAAGAVGTDLLDTRARMHSAQLAWLAHGIVFSLTSASQTSRSDMLATEAGHPELADSDGSVSIEALSAESTEVC